MLPPSPDIAGLLESWIPQPNEDVQVLAGPNRGAFGKVTGHTECGLSPTCTCTVDLLAILPGQPGLHTITVRKLCCVPLDEATGFALWMTRLVNPHGYAWTRTQPGASQ